MTTTTLTTPPSPWPNKWINSYTLDGNLYWFRVTWNDRDGFWYLAVASSNLVSQAQGVTLNIGTDKLRQYKHGEIPPGRFDVVDTNGKYVEPTREDMGTRVVLRYTDFESVEVEDRELFPMVSNPPS